MYSIRELGCWRPLDYIPSVAHECVLCVGTCKVSQRQIFPVARYRVPLKQSRCYRLAFGAHNLALAENRPILSSHTNNLAHCNYIHELASCKVGVLVVNAIV